MKFDEAAGGKTAYEKIVELFARVGLQVLDHPLQPPNIIFEMSTHTPLGTQL